MSNIRVISDEQIKKILRISDTVTCVEQAYAQKNNGSGCVFPIIFHEFIPGKSDMDIKSGSLEKCGIFGLKLVSWFGTNEQKGLPALFGTNLIFNLQTGEPLALMNASHITNMRTGAAGAVGAKFLARKNSKTMLMVGMGELAPYEIAAMICTMENLEKVYLVNPHHPTGMEKRGEMIIKQVSNILKMEDKKYQYQIMLTADIEKAAKEADIIVTATPSRKGFLKREWIKSGTHISCIGADMEGKQELETELARNAALFADDKKQSITVGELEIAIKEKIIKETEVQEIGSVINHEISGRRNPNEITIFDSTGIALQDLIVSSHILKKAEELGIGTFCCI